jgi:hypothetical protein
VYFFGKTEEKLKTVKCFYRPFTIHGFFSEYLNFLGCKIWCRENNYELYIDENLKDNIGGFDTYFVPFDIKKIKFKENWIGKTRLSECKNKWVLSGDFYEKRHECNFKGKLGKVRREQYRKEIEKTYIFNEKFRQEVNEEIKKYATLINEGFVGFHVRRGDKITEVNGGFSSLETYMDRFKNIEKTKENKIKNIFVVSDDPAIVDSFKEKFPSYDFFSRPSTNKSYDQLEFNALSTDKKRVYIKNFLIDLEIIKASKYAIVATSSNVGAFIMLSMYPNCYTIDSENDELFLA